MKMMEAWNTLTKDKEFTDTFFNLYIRWQDEKEYEDIKDYLVYIQKIVPEAFKITKSPFAISVRCDDGRLKILIKKKRSCIKIEGELIENKIKERC